MEKRILDGDVQAHVQNNADCPSVVDIAFFGSTSSCDARMTMIAEQYPDALPIDAPKIRGSVIEIGPDMFSGLARVWGDIEPSGVVLDTGHWRELTPNVAEKLYDKYGGPKSLRMVHLKLNSKTEVQQFLAGQDVNSRHLKEFLAHDTLGSIPVIIEARGIHMDLIDHRQEMLRSLTDRIHHVLA